ncbi:MAG: FkbM family methyltransferase [Rhodothermales bacterium]
MSHFRDAIKRSLRQRGYELHRYPVTQYLADYRIDTILDVGANIGQYGQEMRALGFEGRLISFEPIPSVYETLKASAEADPRWETHPYALGTIAKTTTINISGTTPSSSLLDMLPTHTDALQASAYVGTADIEVQRLDALYPTLCQPSDRVMLKIDTQGYTMHVLEGATGVLDQITGLEIELSLQPLYAGEPLIEEVIAYLRERGFTPVWTCPGFKNATTQHILNMDGYFFRT